MKYACPNCLEPSRVEGQMCDHCRALVNAGWYQSACWVEQDVGVVADYWVDEVYINALKERRMKSFERARRMARRGA